jgi:hypothetical protein
VRCKSAATLRLNLLSIAIVLTAFRSFGMSQDVDVAYFENHIRPLLVEHCYECHSVKSGDASGQLLLDSQPAMLKGGDHGNLLIGSDAAESLLMRVLSYDDDLTQMPPDGRLPDEAIEHFRKWVAAGAPDPRTDATSTGEEDRQGKIREATKSHWAFEPPTIHPLVANESGPQIVDGLIQERLGKNGLQLSPAAAPRTLARRAAVVLTGLVPTKRELNEFETQVSELGIDAAYEQFVDTQMASLHFGERWARHWMDVARYSDTKGYVFQEDREYHAAFKYRDWLIRSFNEDLGYDEFIKSQLAADQRRTPDEENDLPPIGFLTLGRRFLNNPHDIADERIDVVSRGLLGLTVACARCHDHKFDPIGMADYYSLHGVFINSEVATDKSLQITDRDKQRPSFVFLRGQAGNRGDKVERQFVRFLSPEPVPLDNASGRGDLANAIANEANPLTARVFVNRIWGWVFDSYLVDTPSDFGLQCPPPIHQDVLDSLAVDFVRHQWHPKHLIRQLVLSRTFRQSSSPSEETANVAQAETIDIENRLYWRANIRRMDFETYRDSLLLVSGQLETKLFGKSESITELPQSDRRTVYAYIDRQNLPNVFRSFDFANPDAHVPKRLETTVPQQALFAMNGPIVQLAAQRLSAPVRSGRSEHRNSEDDRAAVRLLFEQTLARSATEDEIDSAVQFLRTFSNEPATLPESQWSYGYGNISDDAKTLNTFTPYPKTHGTRRGGEQPAPDPQIGWSFLDEKGGHPGHGREFAAVRRWTAPRNGTIHIGGRLQHKSEDGDGVRATILSDYKSSEGTNSPADDKTPAVRGQWTAANSATNTPAAGIQVVAGQTVDFVVDCQATENSDSFTWPVQIRYVNPAAPEGSIARFDSRKDFRLDEPESADRWASLAQALMSSNEFMFVD